MRKKLLVFALIVALVWLVPSAMADWECNETDPDCCCYYWEDCVPNAASPDPACHTGRVWTDSDLFQFAFKMTL